MKDSPVCVDELTQPQPESDDPAYLAYVEEKVRQGLKDVKHGKTHSEGEVWKALVIKLSPTTKSDLIFIRDYIAQESPAAAPAFFRAGSGPAVDFAPQTSRIERRL